MTFYPRWSVNQAKNGFFYTIPPNLQVRLSCLWCSIRRQFLFKKVDIQWAASSPQSRAEILNIWMKDIEIFTIFFIMPFFNVIPIKQSVGFYLSPQTLVWHKMALHLTVLLSDGECSCKTRVNIPEKTLITALKHAVIPDAWNTGNHCICCGSILSLVKIFFNFISNSLSCYYHTLPYPKTKEKKIWTKDKIEPPHIHLTV